MHYFQLPMTMLWCRNPEGTVITLFENGWFVPWVDSSFDYENAERFSNHEQAYSFCHHHHEVPPHWRTYQEARRHQDGN